MFNRFNFQKKLLLPSVIENNSNEIISVPNTEKILLETKHIFLKFLSLLGIWVQVN